MSSRALVALVLLATFAAAPPAHAQGPLALNEVAPSDASGDRALELVDFEDDGDWGGVFIGIGAGMLAAGIGLDALVLALATDRTFEGSGGETGAALALPPVLVAGGIQLLVTGLARALGADDDWAFRVGSIASLLAAVGTTIAAAYVGGSETRGVGDLGHESSALFLGVHAGASALMGGATFAMSFGFE